MTPTVRELFELLGFSAPGTDIDEAVKWALIELKLRREKDENDPQQSS